MPIPREGTAVPDEQITSYLLELGGCLREEWATVGMANPRWANARIAEAIPIVDRAGPAGRETRSSL